MFHNRLLLYMPKSCESIKQQMIPDIGMSVLGIHVYILEWKMIVYEDNHCIYDIEVKG